MLTMSSGFPVLFSQIIIVTLDFIWWEDILICLVDVYLDKV